ncbi:MAG: hypothetical protein ACRD4K_11915 [Candidatus Acidiferrales bacterium]
MHKLNRISSAMRYVWHRAYADFLMPNRLELYRELLEGAVARGYEAHSVLSFWQSVKPKTLDPNGRYLILRHDIDNRDWQTTRRFWDIERQMRLKSTFYFRMSTLMPDLMREMHDSGFEVGYHYEELATIAKEKGFTKPEQTYSLMAEIRERFKSNLSAFREITGLPSHTVASHGDFANRKLGIENTELLQDEATRREAKIECEAYDSALRDHISTLHSDVEHPGNWTPEDPRWAIERGEHVVHILTHPRNWHADRARNLADELSRMREGLSYLLRARRFAELTSLHTAHKLDL